MSEHFISLPYLRNSDGSDVRAAGCGVPPCEVYRRFPPAASMPGNLSSQNDWRDRIFAHKRNSDTSSDHTIIGGPGACVNVFFWHLTKNETPAGLIFHKSSNRFLFRLMFSGIEEFFHFSSNNTAQRKQRDHIRDCHQTVEDIRDRPYCTYSQERANEYYDDIKCTEYF